MIGTALKAGVPPFWAKLLIEVCVVLFLTSVLAGGRRLLVPPGSRWMLLYVALVFLSACVNGDDLYSAYRFCRYPLYSCLFLVGVWNADLEPRDARRVLNWLLALWAIQVLAAVFQLGTIGQAEKYVGTQSKSGGASATIFPLLAGAYCLSLFLYAPGRKWLLALTFSLPLLGVASGKRGIWFLFPFVIGVTYLLYLKREGKLTSVPRLTYGFVLALVLAGVFLAGIRTVASGVQEGEGILEGAKNAFSYAKEYSLGEEADGTTWGRTATSRRVLGSIRVVDSRRILFGWGPFQGLGANTEGELPDVLQIVYGVVGWAHDVIFVGWPAAICYVFFWLSLWRYCCRKGPYPNTAFGKSLSLGIQPGFVVFILCHFFYSTQFKSWGLLPFTHLCLVGMLVSPKHRWMWQPNVKRHRANFEGARVA